MNVLNKEKQAMAVMLLAEGNSIRGIERITGVHRDTIMRLGVRVGQNCQVMLDEKMRNLDCKRIEADEIWGFVQKKERNRTEKDGRDKGDAWVWMAIDPETKVIPSFLVGKREAYYATAFMEDLAGRLKNRIQLSTDGLKEYVHATERAFGSEIDYAQVVKTFSMFIPEDKRRYSPLPQQAIYKKRICGNPKKGLISTSMIERSNLTLRHHCKRMARLTLAFSKKLDNLKAAIALNTAYYNMCKFHQTLRCTPAMAVGVEKSPWTIDDLLKL